MRGKEREGGKRMGEDDFGCLAPEGKWYNARMKEEIVPDGLVLMELARKRMPFGKYKGILLCDLPEPYLVWFSRQGFPKGRLGMLLATLFEIKANGLEYLLLPLKRG